MNEGIIWYDGESRCRREHSSNDATYTSASSAVSVDWGGDFFLNRSGREEVGNSA